MACFIGWKEWLIAESSTLVAILSGVVTAESIYIISSLFVLFIFLIYHYYYKKKKADSVDVEEKKSY